MTPSYLWYVPLLIYFISSVANTIIQRKAALAATVTPRLISFLAFMLFLWPAGIICALIFGEFHVTWQSQTYLALLFSALGIGGFSIYSIQLNKQVDAIQYSVVTNLNTLVVVLLGIIIVGDTLTNIQFIGMLLLVLGSILIAVKGLNKSAFAFDKYSILLVLATAALGVGIVAERAALNYMSISSYLIIGYGLQTLVLGISSRKVLHEVKKLSKSQWLLVSKIGITRAGWNLGFLLAVVASLNVSLVASISSFRVPLVFVVSYFILSERTSLKRKFIGMIIATLGLVLI